MLPETLCVLHGNKVVALTGGAMCLLYWPSCLENHMKCISLKASCECITPRCSALTVLSAGVAGYTWVAGLHLWLGFSFRTTLLLANITPVAWLYIYHAVLPPPKLEAVSQLHKLTSRSTSASELPGPATDLNTDGAASLLGLVADEARGMQHRHTDSSISLV